MDCSDPNDFSPGSCARINVARLIDRGEYLERWSDIVVLTCKLPEAP